MASYSLPLSAIDVAGAHANITDAQGGQAPQAETDPPPPPTGQNHTLPINHSSTNQLGTLQSNVNQPPSQAQVDLEALQMIRAFTAHLKKIRIADELRIRSLARQETEEGAVEDSSSAFLPDWQKMAQPEESPLDVESLNNPELQYNKRHNNPTSKTQEFSPEIVPPDWSEICDCHVCQEYHRDRRRTSRFLKNHHGSEPDVSVTFKKGDVLSRRQSASHPGNLRFSKLIDENVERYVKSSNYDTKKEIREEIVRKIKFSNTHLPSDGQVNDFYQTSGSKMTCSEVHEFIVTAFSNKNLSMNKEK